MVSRPGGKRCAKVFHSCIHCANKLHTFIHNQHLGFNCTLFEHLSHLLALVLTLALVVDLHGQQPCLHAQTDRQRPKHDFISWRYVKM